MLLGEFVEREVDEIDLVLLPGIGMPERKLAGHGRKCRKRQRGAGDQKTFQLHRSSSPKRFMQRPSLLNVVMPQQKSHVYSDTTTCPC